MVKVIVPATSANVGAGFDALGLALSMHNTVTLEESDRIDILASDGTLIPTGTGNLVYRSAKAVFDQLGQPLKGIRIRQENPIPMARGLGSSSACIVAGILGANALLGSPLTQRQMLTLATSIEGHPDNVAPAMLGGFVTSVYDEGQVYSVRKSIDEELAFAAFIPNFKLLTEKARAALPKTVDRADAVYNLSRAASASLSWPGTWAPMRCTSPAQAPPSWRWSTGTTAISSAAPRSCWPRRRRRWRSRCGECLRITPALW